MKTETAFAIVAVLIAALTFRKANIDLPVTAQNAGGGSNAGSAPPPTPLSMVGDPIESESGFDDITATGSDLVGETPVQVAELVGCVSPQGGSPYGRFLVTIGDPAVASSPSYCADYGDTVSDGGVSVAVSYTHLDVYKRQDQTRRGAACCWGIPHCSSFRTRRSGSPCDF